MTNGRMGGRIEKKENRIPLKYRHPELLGADRDVRSFKPCGGTLRCLSIKVLWDDTATIVKSYRMTPRKRLDVQDHSSTEVLCSLPQKVPCCLLYKLKTIKITNFTDEKDCTGKAKYILKNGGALQKLTIRTGLYISEEEKLEIYQVLLASPRKSKQCRILFI
ncbi:hypothetical protein Goari_017649 [Gossypium aridum]|uniref:FBD domain-containing protein n=1 Tax=Gossypium aridum TaxID=34290 RepID=A0A7J8WMG2_GOSAI|nr:hypothetical protein [Gossypium aridum]